MGICHVLYALQIGWTGPPDQLTDVSQHAHWVITLFSSDEVNNNNGTDNHIMNMFGTPHLHAVGGMQHMLTVMLGYFFAPYAKMTY